MEGRIVQKNMPKKTAHRSGWKSVTRGHKIKKKTKLALAVLGLLIALLLFSQFIQFVKLLTRPLNSKNLAKNYTWNGEFNLNFVVRSNPISLVSYNPKEKKVTAVTTPDETYIDVAGGFGKWQVRSIYDLGQGTKVGGEKLLKQSLSDLFGIPIDGFSSDNLVDVFRLNLFSGITILPNLQTDLTLWELIQLKVGLAKVRFDKIKKIDLEKFIVLDREKLADGTEVFIADPIRLDSVMSDFADPQISAEHISIAIFNATERPLLGQKAKRMITNLGGNVIVIQNAPKNLQKSYVEGEKSKTLERLTQIFDQGCNKPSGKMLALSERSESKCDKIPKSDLGLASMRAQIVVVLGQDSP